MCVMTLSACVPSQKPPASYHHLPAHRDSGVRSHQPGLFYHTLPRPDAQLRGRGRGKRAHSEITLHFKTTSRRANLWIPIVDICIEYMYEYDLPHNVCVRRAGFW